ncbi:MAG: TetR family transcriptional regulator [Acetobacteraceae bacterium]|nr:TetR family transcriptional regulator [Acetobacteraceae bacterium]
MSRLPGKSRARHTRQAVQDAAVEVFFEHGVARASLVQIARAAGVARGALYWHFSGFARCACKGQRGIPDQVRARPAAALPAHRPAAPLQASMPRR